MLIYPVTCISERGTLVTVVGRHALGDGLSAVPELNRQPGMVDQPHTPLSRRSILLLVGVSVSLAACGTPASLRIQQRAKGIEAGFVEFPMWRRTPDKPFLNPDSFIGRFAGEGANRALLVRAGSSRSAVSIDCYAIQLRPPFPVRAAKLHEWEAAVAGTLPEKRYVRLNRGTAPTLEFQGRTYKRQGQLWREATASPGGRWLVLYSHDDGDFTGIGRGTGPMATSTPWKGASYFEVFDTTTGLRVFLAKTRWFDEVRDGAVVWIGDHILILTLDDVSPFHQRCLFVTFP